MELDTREVSAILAGLRLLQAELLSGGVSESIMDIYDNGGDIVPLKVSPGFTTTDEIDVLCEKINTSD